MEVLSKTPVHDQSLLDLIGANVWRFKLGMNQLIIGDKKHLFRLIQVDWEYDICLIDYLVSVNN